MVIEKKIWGAISPTIIARVQTQLEKGALGTFFCRSGQTRTDDHLHPMQVR